MVNGVSKGCARFQSHHRTVCSPCDFALVGLVFFETVSHYGFALTAGKHICSESYYTARRNVKLNVHTVALRFHGRHFAFAARNHVDHFARILFRDIYCEVLDRFTLDSVDIFIDNLRLTYLKFVTLAAMVSMRTER